LIAAAVFLALFLMSGRTWAAASKAPDRFPVAQIDESERYYGMAYHNFLGRAYWEALDYLDRALRVNTYLVDYYLMRGQIMNRTGDYDSGREALSYYMEVRPLDSTTPRILAAAIARQRDLRRSVSSASVSTRWRVSAPDMQSEFGMGVFRPFSVRGLGKVTMRGDALYLADTLGDAVYLCRQSDVASVAVERPSAVVPMGDGSFHVFAESGDVLFFGQRAADTLSPDARYALENRVADAAPLSMGEFVVADPVGREVAFYSFAGMEKLGAWSPPAEGTRLFEPVAVAVYGPWIAVADRGGERVFFLNYLKRSGDRAAGAFFQIDVPSPRDLEWSTMGELLAVSENGSLLRMPVDFQARVAENPYEMGEKFPNAWSVFAARDGVVYCMDIAASHVRRAEPMPDTDVALGFLSVFNPTIERTRAREAFVLDATLLSPFLSYLRSSELVTHAVWNDRTMRATADWSTERRGVSAQLFQRTAPRGIVSPTISGITVENGTDIQMAMPALWSARRDSLTNILADSSIIFSREELDTLTLFCLSNGLKLDIWARTVPSVEMVRSAAITGGGLFYSVASAPWLTPAECRLKIHIPLPVDLSSSGYPSRSMLSIFLDAGLMQTRDWIPLWPDMLDW
jgi:hypothetical protein